MEQRETFTIRAARAEDRTACVAAEQAAIAGPYYLDDVWEMFLADDGELTVAAGPDGTPVAVGKLTRLYGPHAWLETLRVLPACQGRGIGKDFYMRWFGRMAALGLTAVGMYTGAGNRVSRGLAERFGLTLRGTFAELTCPAGAESGGRFAPVPPARGEAAAAPFYADMGGFLAVNRTFFPVRAGLGAELARRGWLFESPEGALLVAGWRFQPQRAVHLAYCSGDAAAALAFASALARRAGAERISAIRETGQTEQTAALLRAGFADTGTRLITLWKGLK